MQPLLVAVEEALRAFDPTATWEQLHASRIAGKHLRYGLAAIADMPGLIVDPAWIEFLKDWQDRLGWHLDHWQMAKQLQRLSCAVSDREAAAWLRHRAAALRTAPAKVCLELANHWREQDGAALRQAILSFLAQFDR